jgi:hypothetical protein
MRSPAVHVARSYMTCVHLGGQLHVKRPERWGNENWQELTLGRPCQVHMEAKLLIGLAIGLISFAPSSHSSLIQHSSQ